MPVQNDQSALHKATGVIGTTVSGIVPYVIAILNVLILVGIVRIFLRDAPRAPTTSSELEEQLERARADEPLLRQARQQRSASPWQMYPLGVLFGLGFDTATEVALLVLAAGAGAAGLPFYAILCLPILFAAGMSLLDTIDGSFMNFAYGWAFSKPVRKVYYNITITGLSVAVALFIGTIELVGLLTRQARPARPRLRTAFRTSTSTRPASSSSACSSSPGPSRWRSGGSRRIEEKWTAADREF